MKVMFACVADHAAVDNVGKLNVMGIFDRINAPGFPVIQPQMYLVFRLILEHDDAHRAHKLVVVLRDADHKEHARFEADVQQGPVDPGAFVTVNQTIRMQNVVFVRPGRYHFAFVADQEDEVRVPFDVLGRS